MNKRESVAMQHKDILTSLLGQDTLLVKAEHIEEATLQRHTAPLLRQAAIKHLREDKTAKKIYNATDGAITNKSWEKWLDSQAKNGAWATAREMIALGKICQAAIVTTAITRGKVTGCFVTYSPYELILNQGKKVEPGQLAVKKINDEEIEYSFFNNESGNVFQTGILQPSMLGLATFAEIDSNMLTQQLIPFLPIILNIISQCPVLHLYCQDETHWYFYGWHPSDTIGDGSCGYNSAAQSLRRLILQTEEKDDDNFLAQFEIHLAALTLMAQKLDARGEAPAAKAAKNLLRHLNAFKNKLADKTINKHVFISSCTLAINIARTELEHHRGWKEVAGNIGLFFGLLVIGYCIALAVNHHYTGRLWFFPTTSAKKLDALEEQLNPAPSCGSLA